VSNTDTEPRRKKNDARFIMPTLQIITTTTTTTDSPKMWYTEVLSFSLSLGRVYMLLLIYVGGGVGNDDEEKKLRFISYVYVHIYICIYGRIWVCRNR
jgi:hypothetical protein